MLDLPFSYKDMADTFMRCFLVQNAEARQTSETSEFWKTLESMCVNGKIREGTHFCIKYDTAFTPLGKNPETREFGRSHAMLYLNYPAVLGVLMQRSGLNQMKMDSKALEHYLKTSVHYLGRKQCRYVVLLPNGSPDITYTTVDGKTRAEYNTVRPNAYVFDYEALKASTEIELESFKSSINPEDEADGDNEPAPTSPQPAPPSLFPMPDSKEDVPF